ncbi:trigger factor [Dialister sp.]|uniref:trigger factor n=1 Tax=Dialister sp. TaxID=1955814 RepID=UPI003EFF4D59
MNVKVEALDQHKVSVGIELPAEVVQKGFKRAVARIANQVRIPGFRKGKANRKILEMHFGKEAIEAEAKDIVINEAVEQALSQEKLIPVTAPDVKEDKFSEAEGAAFTATFVKRPEVELGEYKNLEAKRENPEISDDQVMAQLKGAAEQNARLEKAEDGAELKKGDFAVIDFKGTVDGKPFEGGEGKTYPLEIGSQSFIPGFEDQLEGHKAGDDVTVKVTFPDNYFVDALKGKEAEFKVHISDVKRKQLPELNDDFAKSISQFETMDELKAAVKQQMQLQAIQQAEEAYHEALVNQAVANAKVDIPQEMIEQRIDEIVDEIKLNMESRNSTMDDYLKNIGQTMEQLRKNYEKMAADQVRQGLVLETIADKEGLNVTNNDLSMEVYSMAHQFNADPKDVMKIIRDENRVGMLVNSVLRKKAAAFIYGAAKKAEEDKKEAPAEEKAEEAPKAAEEAEAKKDDGFESMTVKDLKAYAAEKGIALESKAKKAEIIETIRKAESK